MFNLFISNAILLKYTTLHVIEMALHIIKIIFRLVTILVNSYVDQSTYPYSIDIHSITCDGAPTNFDGMRSFGCKFGKNVNDIKGSFSVLEDTVILFSK